MYGQFFSPARPTIPGPRLGSLGFMFDPNTTASNAPATTSSFLPSLPNFQSLTSNWLALGAGGLLLWWLAVGSPKKSAKQKAREAYERKLKKIDEEYSVRGRLKRAGSRARSGLGYD